MDADRFLEAAGRWISVASGLVLDQERLRRRNLLVAIFLAGLISLILGGYSLWLSESGESAVRAPLVPVGAGVALILGGKIGRAHV